METGASDPASTTGATDRGRLEEREPAGEDSSEWLAEGRSCSIPKSKGSSEKGRSAVAAIAADRDLLERDSDESERRTVEEGKRRQVVWRLTEG